MRLEMLAPEYWLLLLLVPPVLYFALKTYADSGRARKITVAVLRTLILVLVAGSLARVRLWRSADESRLCVLALVDVSESMPREKTLDSAKEIAELSKNADADHQYGLLLFAGRCRVCVPPSPKPISEESARALLQSALDSKAGTKDFDDLERNETRYEQALELAASVFPAGIGRRIVLWTDGNETDGSGLALASRLKQSGIDLNARTVESKDRPLDVLVSSLDVPTQVRNQEAFDAKVALMSTREASGKVLLYRNGFLTGTKEVTLAAGATEVSFRQSISESGQYVYRAVFDTKDVQPKENDEAFAYLTATGAPHILVIGVHELESTRLISALRSAKSFVEYRDAYGSPQGLLELFGYDAVVLNNVPAAKLSENQMRMLRDYVRDFGGGLVVIGGQHSLTAGGYAGTALEDVLPVSCSTEGLPAPSMSVALVVDASRSLTTQRTADGKPFDAPAFVRTVSTAIADKLSSNDFFGVIVTGNEKFAPHWPVRMQKVYDRDRIHADLERDFANNAAFGMRSNDYLAIRRAAEELAQQDTRRKHIVVLSDGFFDSGYSYPRLTAKLNADHYQVSTIPVGPESDFKVLEEMARWGGGLCVQADDSSGLADGIKALFSESQGEALAEDPFRPRKLLDSNLIDNVDISSAPMLFGYIRTKLKTGASNILAVPPEYDPLLASWDCGEGRAVVFTSDVKDKWSVLWSREWGRNFESFWSGVVLGTAKRSPDMKLSPHLRVSGQSINASVDLLDAKERFISGKNVHAELFYLGEQGCMYTRSNMERVELAPTGPGRYTGSHRINRKGLYAVKFRGPDRGQVVGTGVVVSNFREYLTLSADSKFLKDLCDAGGGQVDAGVAALASTVGKKRETLTDLGHWAIFAACLLFVADVAARRWPAILRLMRRRTA
jgi:Ca-activated chloride channel family protein